MSVTQTKRGSRIIELFVPFEWDGHKVRVIELGPFRYDHFLRWQEGEFKSAHELLVELSHKPETYVRQLCYPDTDRIMAAFIDMVPPMIQTDIAKGLVPGLAEVPEMPAETEPAPEPEPEREPEPGWPYQGSPPANEDTPPAPEPEPEVHDFDLMGEA